MMQRYGLTHVYLSLLCALTAGILALLSFISFLLDTPLVFWAYQGEILTMAPSTAIVAGLLSLAHCLLLWYLHRVPILLGPHVQQEPQTDQHQNHDTPHHPQHIPDPPA